MLLIKKILSYFIYFIPFRDYRWKLYRLLNLYTPQPLLMRRISKHFFNRTNYTLNWEKPRTLNEKIQWLKLNYRNKNMPLCADKVLVREYVAECGFGNILTKSYGIFDHFDDIDFDLLPKQFVIKVNHNSGGVFIIKDKNNMNKSFIKKRITSLLNSPYTNGLKNGEWHYLKIEPKIIIEEYLLELNNNLLDYKFHCFNGKPKYIQVDVDRETNHTRTFYDADWQNMKFTNRYPLTSTHIKKPIPLARMLDIAQSLSQDFPYARIDLYAIEEMIYFGEITFFHENGMGKFEPESADLMLGEQLDISSLKNREQ